MSERDQVVDLPLHIAVARGVRIVAFFAPTSAAEIELYGLGEKLASTPPAKPMAGSIAKPMPAIRDSSSSPANANSASKSAVSSALHQSGELSATPAKQTSVHRNAGCRQSGVMAASSRPKPTGAPAPSVTEPSAVTM